MTSKRVLIIDDDKTMVTLMTTLLRKEGLQVTTAFDGMSGFMAAQKQRPDLILLDMQMPAGGGEAVWKRLAASAHTVGIPVVYVTGTTSPGFAAEAESQGAAGVIKKPFDPESFAERVMDFFKRATGQQEAFQE
ncbi:MAG TPA: response regulator [Gemmatimonadales bacterium]|nr:response regulator [Gemmatimonadales bacterium]